MIGPALEFVPSVLAGIAAALTFLWQGRSRGRISLLALYLIAAWQIAGTAPVQVGMGRAVVGAAVTYILVRSASSRPTSTEESGPLLAGMGLRAAAILLVLIPVSGVWGLGVLGALPATTASGLGSLWVMGLGALQVGLSRGTEPRVVGLLTLLLGFEMIYIALEPSLALTVLLAAVHLGLAVLSGYLISLAGQGEGA